MLCGVALALAIMAVMSYRFSGGPTAEQVMADFYAANGRAEDMLMDPLILHADLVAPIVIESIRDKQMDKRRYAIGFLGNEKISSALPVLRTILTDETEEDYFRADALESIYQIERSEWLSLDKLHADRGDYLGRIATGLLSGDTHLFHRTYIEALVGHND